MLRTDIEDEQLVLLAREDGELMDSLISRYKPYINASVRSFFLTGGDKDDLMQEATIGFFKAVMTYAPDKNTSFRTFASKCIRSQIYDAIKAATRTKHKALNTSVPLIYPTGEEGEIVYRETIDFDNNPENILITRESEKRLNDTIRGSLSVTDRQILIAYLNGLTYQQIADHVDKTPKYVDNALQRIKRNLSFLKENRQ